MNWIYKNNSDNSSRYVLGVAGNNTILCMGVNPSTAEPLKLDPTMRKVKSIAECNGYDGWMMINLYPRRSTDFDGLAESIEVEENEENLRQISDILCDKDELVVWLAFGNHIYDREYLIGCLRDIYKLLSSKRVTWLAAGVNKSGAPKHPLYLRKDTPLSFFDIEEYLKNA